jgi:HK97 family phage portal protein
VGLIERIRADRAEKRVIGGVPWRPWENPYWKFNIGGPVHPSRTAYGQEQALGLPALYSCTRLLAESLASLPLKIYISPPGTDVTTRYTGPSIFDQPSADSDVTLFDWLYQMMTALLLHGNAWGLISGRDGYGYPTGIEWVPPERVQVQEDSQQPWNPMRTRVYVDGRLMPNWRDDLFHVRGYALPGRTEGLSPLRAFAMTVMGGIESGKYGVDWYLNGGFPSGVFQNQELEVSAEDAREIRESLMEAIHGHKPLVIGRDWDYKPVSVAPSEAQFIEATQMNATQVAAVYGLPPDRVGGRRGDSLTYNCADAETEILTTRGWLRHDQVTTGDTCLTLNTSTGMAEWQPVSSVHVFEDGPYPVIKMENLSHSSVTTPDHRWPVMISGRPGGSDGYQWRTTETLPWDARICAAAPAVTPAEPKWSDALVELVAWLWTEGWHNEHGSVTLTQSERVNPGNTARIRAALTEVFGSAGELQVRSWPSWREDHDERAVVHFRLNARAGRQLLEHAPGKVVSTEFLSQLTRAQLELFYQASMDADGIKRPSGRGAVMAQKDRARLEAFQVACALTGRSGAIRGPGVAGMYTMSIQVTPWRKPKGHPGQYVTHETADLVWCVQTPNKSWFARRNGTCYFTGNTVEQSTLQVIEALRPWIVRLETAFFRLLPQNRFCRFNADALLKTDLKTRTEIYAQQRAIGMLTVDEIRDMEDRMPYPNATGDEKIPQDVMVAMSRSIRGIPNSMLPSITLEVDLIADRLTKLQDEGLTRPETGPSVPNPEDFLSGQVGSVRSSAPSLPHAALAHMQELLAEHVGREAAARIIAQSAQAAGIPRKQPEFVGPWIPTEDDLARAHSALAAATGGSSHLVPFRPAEHLSVNGNGNGRH